MREQCGLSTFRVQSQACGKPYLDAGSRDEATPAVYLSPSECPSGFIAVLLALSLRAAERHS
jgi:hypothetical protein